MHSCFRGCSMAACVSRVVSVCVCVCVCVQHDGPPSFMLCWTGSPDTSAGGSEAGTYGSVMSYLDELEASHRQTQDVLERARRFAPTRQPVPLVAAPLPLVCLRSKKVSLCLPCPSLWQLILAHRCPGSFSKTQLRWWYRAPCPLRPSGWSKPQPQRRRWRRW